MHTVQSHRGLKPQNGPRPICFKLPIMPAIKGNLKFSAHELDILFTMAFHDSFKWISGENMGPRSLRPKEIDGLLVPPSKA